MKRILVKGQLIIVVTFTILILLIVFPKQIYAISQQEALNWVYAQENKKLDYDGQFGSQCVDLIKYYYAQFGVADYAMGNAYKYASNSLPPGWTRIQNTASFVPEPGDIAVWTTAVGNGNGHVAIVLSADLNSFNSMDQNWPYEGAPCSIINHSYNSVWGFVRPAFDGTSHIPYGALDGAEGGVGTIRVYGWAKDDDAPDQALTIHVYIDGPAGTGTCIKSDIIAGNDSSDVGKHRYDVTFPTNYTGTHSIYVYAINAGEGNHNPVLSGSPKTITITERNHVPYGALDGAVGGNGTIRVYGWAKDDDAPNQALTIHVYIDGPAGTGKCIKSDIIAGNNSSDVGKHRFDVTFSTNYTGSHSIYAYAINAGEGNHNPVLEGSPRTVTITKLDTERPVVHGGSLEVISDKLCRFTINATDNVGVDHVDIHTWYDSWSSAGDTPYSAVKSGNNWYYDVPYDFTKGSRRMDARVYDAAGNQAVVSGTDNTTCVYGRLDQVDVYFDANGGSCNTISSKIICCRFDYRVTNTSTYSTKYGDLPNASRTGYDFDGWYTEKTGGTKITSATKVTNNESHTLYAHWIENEYIISYYSDEGTGIPAPQTKMWSTELVLSADVPVRQGHIFIGWSDGETIYQPGDMFNVNADTTLVAIWEPVPDFILPTSLTVIEEDAFEGGSFTFVVVPASVTEIGPRAFADCENLKHIRFLGKKTIIDETAFDGVDDLTFHVPNSGTAYTYARAYGYEYVVE